MRKVRAALPSDRASTALAAATLVTTSGDGLYIVGGALFFTRGLGMPATRVGMGLTVAGLLSLVAGIAFGRLADRRGAREVTIALLLVQAGAVAAYVIVDSFVAFITVATLALATMQGSNAAQAALISSVAGGDRVRLRAYLHSVTNLGMSVGGVAAGFLVAAGTHRAYDALMLLNAVSFVVSAALVALVPSQPALARPRLEPDSTALRDSGFLVVTGLNGVMGLQFLVLTFAMPLWVIGHTAAPRWLVSPMFLTNTALIVALQVRFSRGTARVDAAALAFRRAGVTLAAAMALYAFAGRLPAWPAALVLVAAALVHTFGELFQTSGAFSLAYGLAPVHAVGQYQGVFGLGFGLSRAVAPLVLALVCLDGGSPGWVALGALFMLAGMLMPSATRWAARQPARAFAAEPMSPAPADAG